jgi:acetyl-CoA synthetase
MTATEPELAPGFQRYPERLNIAAVLLDRNVREGRGERVAMHCGEETMTYAELLERANRAGNALRSLGIGNGDRVVIRAANSLDYVAVVLGAIKIGAVAIPSNTLFRAWELRHTIENSDAKVVLTEAEVRGPVDEVAPACPVLLLDTEFARLLDESSPELEPEDTAADDPAYAIYTSGTTGKPKGVEHAHRTIVAAGDPVVRVQLQLTPDDNIMVPIELASLITLDFSVFWPLYVGARGSLIRGRFDPERFFADLERLRITMFMGVPTMFRFLCAFPGVERFDLSSVRMVLVGGEPLPEDTYRAVKERFGWEMYEMIGSTEAHPYIANLPGRPPRVGSMGVTLPGRECKILDEDGNELPPGEVGHLCLRSDDPAIALGYRKMEAEWQNLHRHGWFYSGDLAYRDEDGYFWFVSRADEVILSRAYRISPGEVEAAVLEHPAVLEAAAIGVPDEEIGQRVKAFVVLKPDQQPAEALADEIKESVRSLIAPYKCPKEIEFAESLPKTMSGKIQRKLLREREAAA